MPKQQRLKKLRKQRKNKLLRRLKPLQQWMISEKFNMLKIRNKRKSLMKS